MLKLRDIMTRDVLTVDPDLSIRDAMELLTSRHVGGAPVMAGTRVVGVISMTDLAELAASLPGTPTERPTESFEESESPTRIDGDPDSMFFTEMWSDAGGETVERFAALTGPEWNALEEHAVKEVMTREIRALPPITGVLDAAKVMTAERIHRVLVMDGDTLLGIVSLTDIARAAAAHKLSTRTYVFGHPENFDDRSTRGMRAG